MARHVRDGGDYGDEVYDDTGAENVSAAELLDLITAGDMVVARLIGPDGKPSGGWSMFTPVDRDPRPPRPGWPAYAELGLLPEGWTPPD